MRNLVNTWVLVLIVVTAIAPPAMGIASKISKEPVYHHERHSSHQTQTDSAIRRLAFPWPFGRSEAVGRSAEFERQLLDTGLIRTTSILFEPSSANLRRQSRRVLDDIGRLLSQHPNLRIEISGHTDSRGSDFSNSDLSKRRAAAVKRYLVKEFPSIRPENLTTVGYGESQPVASNESYVGRKDNRRVEFKVLD